MRRKYKTPPRAFSFVYPPSAAMDLVDFTTAKSDKTRKLSLRSKFLLTFYEHIRSAFTHNWYRVNWLKNKNGLAPLSSGGYRTFFLSFRTRGLKKMPPPRNPWVTETSRFAQACHKARHPS